MSSGRANDISEPNQWCVMIGTAESKAITVRTTANSLPILPRMFRPKAGVVLEKAGRRDAGHLAMGDLVRLRLKREVDCLGFVTGNRYTWRLLSVVSLPRSHGVLSGWKIGQAESAVLSGDRVVRGFQYC